MSRNKQYSGLLAVLEGIDFAGKSTALANVQPQLEERFGADNVLFLREPGSTPVAEDIRHILTNSAQDMDPLAKSLLFTSARREITTQVIVPALKAGKLVVLDRFVASTLAYQHGGDGLDLDMLHRLTDVATTVDNYKYQLDVSIYLNLPIEIARQRKADLDRGTDALDAYDWDYYQKVADFYLPALKQTTKPEGIIDVVPITAKTTERYVAARVFATLESAYQFQLRKQEVF